MTVHSEAARGAVAAAVAAADAVSAVFVTQVHGVTWSYFEVGEGVPRASPLTGCSIFFEPSGGLVRICINPATARSAGPKGGSGDGAWTVALLDCRGALFSFPSPGTVAISIDESMVTTPTLAVGSSNALLHDDGTLMSTPGGTAGKSRATAAKHFCHVLELNSSEEYLQGVMKSFKNSYCAAPSQASSAVKFFCPIALWNDDTERGDTRRRPPAFVVVTEYRLCILADSYPALLAQRNTFPVANLALKSLVFSNENHPGLLLCMQQQGAPPVHIELFGRAEDIEQLHRTLSQVKLRSRLSDALVPESSALVGAGTKVKHLLGLTKTLRQRIDSKHYHNSQVKIIQMLLKLQQGTPVRIKRVRAAMAPLSQNTRQRKQQRQARVHSYSHFCS